MAKLIPLVSDTLWHRIETEPKDWESTDPALLSRMLEQLYIIRAFEEKVLELFKAGCIHGPAHASIGQEGGAVAAISTLSSMIQKGPISTLSWIIAFELIIAVSCIFIIIYLQLLPSIQPQILSLHLQFQYLLLKHYLV